MLCNHHVVALPLLLLADEVEGRGEDVGLDYVPDFIAEGGFEEGEDGARSGDVEGGDADFEDEGRFFGGVGVVDYQLEFDLDVGGEESVDGAAVDGFEDVVPVLEGWAVGLVLLLVLFEALVC
jgi:hypothetical protein